MKLITASLGNAKIEIHVDQNGTFSAEFEDQHFTAKTQAELLEILKRVVKKAERQGSVDVSVIGIVPATKTYGSREPFQKGDGVVDAKLRGAHERQSHCFLLVTDDKAKQRFQAGRYSSGDGTICRRLNLAETTEYLRLCEAHRVAETALEDFIGAAKIDPEQALADARKKP